MPILRNARKVEIYRDPTRYTCQVGATQLANGEVVLAHTFGSDTPSVMQLADGTLLCNFLMTAFVGRKAIFEDFGAQSDLLTSMRECDGVWLTRSADDGQTWAPAYKASVSPMRWGQPSDEPPIVQFVVGVRWDLADVQP